MHLSYQNVLPRSESSRRSRRGACEGRAGGRAESAATPARFRFLRQPLREIGGNDSNAPSSEMGARMWSPVIDFLDKHPWSIGAILGALGLLVAGASLRYARAAHASRTQDQAALDPVATYQTP